MPPTDPEPAGTPPTRSAPRGASRAGRLGDRAGRAWHSAGPASPNPFGLLEAALGFIAGVLVGSLAVSFYAHATGQPATTGTFAVDLLSLAGLWAGLLVAMVMATAARRRPPPAGARSRAAAWWGRFAADYGVALRPWPDLVLGPVVGVASQLALVPLLELPLLPFVHHLSQQVGKPAQQLTAHVTGPGLVVLALFVCVGSPVVEELFFRGLLLRALLGATARMTATLRVVVSIGLTSLLFALAHFEAVQFLGLAGFGAVLGVLAWRTGRLGPGMAAHASFNAVAIISIVLSR